MLHYCKLQTVFKSKPRIGNNFAFKDRTPKDFTSGVFYKFHFKQEYNLQDANKFQWIQLVHAIPNNWKNIIVNDKGDSFNLAIENHHLIKKNLISCIEKLESKELYFMQILSQYTTPSSQIYFENLFQEKDFEWNKIYLLPRLITVDPYIVFFIIKFYITFFF